MHRLLQPFDVTWQNSCGTRVWWKDPAGYGGETSLVIEFRLYSSPATSDPMTTDYWADYVCVTAPATACINFPQGASPVEDSSWSTIKALYK